MSGISDKATVTLNVNGAQAKQMMADLEKKVKSTEQAIVKLKAANADPKDIEKQRKLLKNYKKQLDEMRSATEGVNRAFKSLDTATPRQLEKTLKTLNKQLKDIQPGTKAWDEHTKKIQQVNAQLKVLKQQIQGQESLWQRFSKWWFQCGQAVAALVMGFQQLISTLRGYVNDYASMEELMADTRKFTGLSEQDVKDLNESFKKLDTRTPREKLNELAQEAGRLGKNTKEDVMGYVRAADITNVALSELGEGATETIAKISNIFNVESQYGTEQSILKVGSTVNDLAQSCSATSNYIVEFSKRLAGVGAQAKMTVPEIMAFAAVLDANGQNVEMSATALSQTVMKLFQKPADIAKSVGLDVEEFTETLKRNTTEGLMMFLDAIDKMGGDNALATLSPLFKDLGFDGARMATVLSVLAGKLDMVREKMGEANAAFEEGKSTTEEFAVFNNTVEASIDKAKNRIHELSVELGGKLYPLMKYLTTTSSAALKVLNVLVDFFIEYKYAIVAATTTIIAYKVALNLSTIAMKLHAAWVAISTTAIKAWRGVVLLSSAAVYLFTGRTVRATAAIKLLSTMLKTTPWGFAIAAIGAIATGLIAWATNVGKVTAKQKMLNQIENEAHKNAAEKLTDLKILYAQTQDNNLALDKRYAAIDKLQKTYPEYFKNISKEAFLIGQAKNAYDQLTESILNTARVEARKGRITQLEQEIVDLDTEYKDDYDEVYNSLLMKGAIFDTGQEVDGEINKYPDLMVRYRLLKAVYVDVVKQKKQLQKELTDEVVKTQTNSTSVTPEVDDSSFTSDSDGGGGGYTSVKLTEKEAERKALEEKRALAKANEEYRNRMEGAKGDWEAAKADNVVNYSQGLISYEEYIAEKERIDLKYIEDRINIYNDLYKNETAENKKLLLKYDEDYQELLLKKAEMEKKHADAASKRKVQDLQREYKKELDAWNLMFNNPDSDWYGDSFAQQEKLHELKIEYLTKYRDAYKENSQEWVQYQQQIEDAEAAHILNRRKMYVQELESWRKKYSEQSLEQRKKMEVAVVQALLDANLISLDEYKKKVEEITKIFQSAKDNAPSDPDADPSKKQKSWFEMLGVGGDMTSAKRKLKEAKAELARQLSAHEISKEEYVEKLKKIDDDYLQSMMQKFTQSLDPLGQSALKLAGTFADVFKSISENGEISFDNIADIAAATFGAMSAGLAMYGQFAEAQSKIEIANVERKYDREIEAMQGNTYKTAKLEKKKEAEVAKLKAEATKKEFNIKVAQAVANTAQSAILGYMAGSQAPFPMNLWLAPTLAGLATATGMVQLAIIKKQQKAAEAEGYAEGGFTKPGPKYEPAGVVHAGEWVASQKLLASPVARPLIEALDYVQRTNTIGSLKSEDVSRAITAPQSLSRIMERDSSSALLVAAVAQSSEVVERLADRLEKPIAAITTVAGDYGINQAQEEYDALLRNVTPKSKQK